MENVDKRVNIKLITEWESASTSDSSGPKRHCGRSLISKSNFHSVRKFSENFFAFQIKRLKVLYNKPLYLGFAVLDLSKWKMYDFHYNYIKPKYNENVQLNYMDTDSFIYTINTEDFYKDIQNDVEMKFDTSDYSDELLNLYNFPKANKKRLGFLKMNSMEDL